MSANKLNTIISDPVTRAALEKRFWSKIDRRGPDECWPWLAKAVITTLKYGAVNLQGVVTGAHRVAYALHNQGIPEEGVIRHSCDNPKCCNPKHLLAGTQGDNQRDMVERGRHYTGEMTPDRIARALATKRAKREAGEIVTTERQREAVRATLAKRWADPEFRRQWSLKMGGENSPFRGRTFKHSPEARMKISQAQIGKKRSEETKQKMRIAAQLREARKRQQSE